MADNKSLPLILALSAFAVPIFIVAIACNATSVATVYWVSVTVSGLNVTESQVLIGLWKVCAEDSGICVDYDPTSASDPSDEIGYVYASRALAIVPPVISVLITLPLVLAGLITRKGILFALAAGTAMLKAACLVSALVVFFVKTMLLFDIEVSGVNIEVLPGWSFYVGGAGVLFYFFGALWLIFLAIATTTIMKRQERNTATVSLGGYGGIELTAQANTDEGYNYRPLTAFSE